MPALPSVAKVLKVQYDWTISEDLGARSRQFFQYTGAGASEADMNTLASTIFSSYVTNLAPMAHPTRVLTSVEIMDLSSPTAPVGVSFDGGVGTRTGGDLPASAALLESGEIDRRYRGGHPRTYWPFGTDTDLQDAQTWTAAFLTAVTAALTAHFTDWSTDLVPGITTVAPVNVSYYEGFTVHTGTTGRARNVSTPRLAPVVDAVIEYIIRLGIAQVRRRLLKLA
jgi:hypothetical protein